MDARLNRQSLALGVPGLILQLTGFALLEAGPKDDGVANGLMHAPVAAAPLYLLGTLLVIGGLSLYAQAKGRSRWWCILGFLSLLGLIALGLLGDKHQPTSAEAAENLRPNLLARLSIYVGILGLIPLLGVIFGAAAVVMGLVAHRRCQRDPSLGGSTAAAVGTMLGAVCTLGWIVLVVLTSTGFTGSSR